jgi:hypothetical protein
VAFTVALPQPAHADHVTPPPVPSKIEVPAGNTAFLEGHAVGTQNYICLPSGWTFSSSALFGGLFYVHLPANSLFDVEGELERRIAAARPPASI